MKIDQDKEFVEDPFWRFASGAMDLPDPFGFRSTDAENPDEVTNSHDLLHNFYGKEGRGPKNEHLKQDKDRRLNLLRNLCENDLQDEMRRSSESPVKRLDPNSNLKFLGEQLVSASM